MKIPQKTIPLRLFSSSGDYLSDRKEFCKNPRLTISGDCKRNMHLISRTGGIYLSLFANTCYVMCILDIEIWLSLRYRSPKENSRKVLPNFFPFHLCFLVKENNMFSTTHVSSHFFELQFHHVFPQEVLYSFPKVL